MSTITVPRPNLTADEVSAVLRNRLGPRYRVTKATTARFHRAVTADANSLRVKRNWLLQTNVRVVPGATSTEIDVGAAPSFTLGGFLINRIGITYKVQHVLQHAPELTGPS